MRKIIGILICLSAFSLSNAQEKVQTTQPTIMVVPFIKEGQDLRTEIEKDFNKRIAISKVKEAFDKRGFTTVDFLSKLKLTMREMQMNADTKSDIKSLIISQSGSDMYVDTDLLVQKSASGNSVKIILQAYDTYTGQSLANKTGDSGKFYTEDIAKLSQKAIESVIEDFLNILNTKFGEIVKNGRTVRIYIGFDQNSDYDFDSEIGNEGDTLADVMEDWLDDNAYKNNYHMQGSSTTSMIIDEFKIPLKDSRGRNYKVSKVGRNIRKFLRTLNLQAKSNVVGAGKINVTIL